MIFFLFSFFSFSLSVFSKERIEVIGHKNNSLSKNILDKTQFLNFQTDSFADHLSLIPGFFVEKSLLTGSNDVIFYRGKGPQQLKFFYDFVPLDYIYHSLNYLPVKNTSLIEKISFEGENISLSSQDKANSPFSFKIRFGSFGERNFSWILTKKYKKISFGYAAEYKKKNNDYPLKGEEALFYKKLPNAGLFSLSHDLFFTYKEDFSLTKGKISFGKSVQKIPGQAPLFYEKIEEEKESFSSLFSHLFYLNSFFSLYTKASYFKDHYHFKDPLGEQTGIKIDQKTFLNFLFLSQECIFKNNFFKNIVKIERHQEEFFKEEFTKKKEQLFLEFAPSVFFYPLSLEGNVKFSLKEKKDENILLRMTLNLNQNFSLFFSWKKNQRNPTLLEKFMTKGLMVGNEFLKPEISTENEVGILWKKEEDFFKMAFFKGKTENLIHYYLVSGFQIKPFNFEEIDSAGLEFSESVSFYNLFKIKSTFNYLELKEKRTQKRPHNRPNVFGYLSVEYTPFEKIHLITRYSYALNRYANKDNTARLPDKYSLDLEINFFLNNSNNKISFGSLNILNRENYDYLDQPLQLRSFYASLSYSF